jgi:hypothetical protein
LRGWVPLQHVILGALPFQSMLEDFKERGIHGVVTLNEDFEVFITTEQYKVCLFVCPSVRHKV